MRMSTRAVMRWWGRSRGMPSELYQALQASLPPNEARRDVLAWAETADGVCVATSSGLSFGGAGEWRHVGWHDIERGGWNADTSTLRWRLYDGSRGSIGLVRPRRLPEVFRERVAASIVLQAFVPVQGRDGVRVVARRSLGAPDSPVIWRSTVSRGLRGAGVDVQSLADRAVDQVRREYDIS